MRKFIGICGLLILVGIAGIHLFYSTSFTIGSGKGEPEVWAKTQNKLVYIKDSDAWVPFQIMGVDLGAGMPGRFATEFHISYETYMEWFALISEMNANVVRVYTIQSPDFYRAFYDYNTGREVPLYLLHGVWVDDDVMRSMNDAFVDSFRDVFKEDCRKLVDVLHGQRTIQYNSRYAYGRYRYDVSDWVLGYILGIEWDQDTVLYTDDIREEETGYAGEYLYTTPDVSAFETMLAQVGDEILRYETVRYGQQRLLAFSNWPETDPLKHSQWRLDQATNLATIDVEHILQTEAYHSGMFASYHVYPYYPLFLDFERSYSEYYDENGVNNPYRGYLRALNDHHTIPVVISEFGLPSSRGVARVNLARGMNQGGLSEAEQAARLPQLFEDIMAAGCAGAVIFEWHDEWFKRTWNTWPGIDLTRNAYWSDYQTNEQFFGLITFDPGETESICYVDGNLADWEGVEIATSVDGLYLQVQYDEKFIYFRIHAEGFTIGSERLYIPVDITDHSGALSEAETGLTFDLPVDFLLVIDGEENSRVLVQAYYDVLYATERRAIWGEDAFVNKPEKDTDVFHLVQQYLRGKINFLDGTYTDVSLNPTGMLKHGNANPNHSDFDSLADFIFAGEDIEIRIPYAMFNFADPSTMRIHDDYYVHYGVEYQSIDHITFGLVYESGEDRFVAPFEDVKVAGWVDDPSSHMRIKAAYHTMREAFGRYTEKGD